jgi:hypothetical protein
MFYRQCNDCNERWELGTASTCTCAIDEPVAWEQFYPEMGKPKFVEVQDGECKRCTNGCPACDARKLPEQKPYAFEASMYSNDRMKVDPVTGNVSIGKPQRTWVGLTDKEIEEIWKIAMFTDYGIGAELSNQPFVHYARAIEAKLKDKNESKN